MEQGAPGLVWMLLGIVRKCPVPFKRPRRQLLTHVSIVCFNYNVLSW